LAVAASAVCRLSGLTPFGCFFLFDFPAELFVFGVFGFAALAFVVDFFDRNRFLLAVGVFDRIGLPVVVCFFFAVFRSDKRRRRGQRQGQRVRGGGRSEQHQRGEQEDQQVREFPHGPFIGAEREPA
jgi:hypothetical protein